MGVLDILNIWLLGVIFLSFVKLKWAVSLFIAYIMLIPYINLNLPFLGNGENFIRFIILLGCFLEMKKHNIRISFRPLIPFFIYFIILLIIIPFQDGMSQHTIFVEWRRDFLSVLILPFVIWNAIKMDTSSIALFRNTILFCIIVAIGYGLILTRLDGVNPYAMYFLQFNNTDANFESYYLAVGEGRLFGRISSVYIHPMSFAFFIGMAFFYLLYYIIEGKSKKICVIMLIATMLMAIYCGVRSVLGGLFVALLYYFVMKKNFKLLLGSFLVGLLCIYIVSFDSMLYDYLSSMIDNKSDKIAGSSVEMRLQQLVGAITEASKNPLFGLGYNWTGNYMRIYGNHPVCLAFESLICSVICNSGIIGVALWIFVIVQFFLLNSQLKINDKLILNTMLVYYLSYSIITGEYGYMKTFLIFYVLLYGESYKNQKQNINKYGYKKTNYDKVINDVSTPVPSNR